MRHVVYCKRSRTSASISITGGPHPRASGSAGRRGGGGGAIIFIPNQFPGDADASGTGATDCQAALGSVLSPNEGQAVPSGNQRFGGEMLTRPLEGWPFTGQAWAHWPDGAGLNDGDTGWPDIVGL